MNFTARILVILFACFVASLAAGMVVTIAALYPAWSNLVVDPVEGDILASIAVFSALFLSFFAVLPWALVIIVAESLSLRSALFYAAAGGGVACLVYFGASGWSTRPFIADGFARRELEIMTGAGIVAGWVYWAIAGRAAGAWRAPEDAR